MKKYSKINSIGKGSFGCALLVANKEENNKKYVIKIIDTKNLKPKQIDDSINEINILKNLNHPFVISYKESFKEKKYICIVMDYADGFDLYKVINNKKEKKEYFTEEIILDYFTQIALAVDYIHSKKILHRDLKTQNIFLNKNNQVKLGDFGVSRIMQGTYDCAKTAIGTPYYLSPEICREQPYNHKSDIWSLGCILYELTTLTHAFDGKDIRGLIINIKKGIYDPIPNYYSSELKKLLKDLLQSYPQNRPNIKQVLNYPIIKNHIQKISEKYNFDLDYLSPDIKINLSKKFEEVANEGKENKNLLNIKNKSSNKSFLKKSSEKKVILTNKDNEIKLFNPIKTSNDKSKIKLISPESNNRKSSFSINNSKSSKNLIKKRRVSRNLSFINKSIDLQDQPLKSDFLFKNLPNISEKDNIFYKFEALRIYLEKQLGLNYFKSIYNEIKEQIEKNQIDNSNKTENKFIPMIYQMIFLEDEIYD